MELKQSPNKCARILINEVTNSLRSFKMTLGVPRKEDNILLRGTISTSLFLLTENCVVHLGNVKMGTNYATLLTSACKGKIKPRDLYSLSHERKKKGGKIVTRFVT